MDKLELRPLSIGEILDRSFSLYRDNFLLFIALAAIPRLPGLLVGLIQVQNVVGSRVQFTASVIVLTVLGYLLGILGYLFSQGGAVIAVSELYLGRQTTIVQALRRVADDIVSLLGVVILNGLAIFVGFICFIIPGVYLLCRLFVVVAVALIERKNPIDSLSRSMALTKGFAGRAFVILILYLVIAIGFGLVIGGPIGLAIAASARNPGLLRAWASLQLVLSAGLEILLQPILLIAASIFYYDLRVRKEAFDIQVMMDPEGANIPRSNLRSVVPEHE
jgi:hypothetical protein